MSSYINVGCAGGDCPKKEVCQRYIDRDVRPITFMSAPWNNYDGEFACGYYEIKKKEES